MEPDPALAQLIMVREGGSQAHTHAAELVAEGVPIRVIRDQPLCP